jgi:hypothetical protein
MGDIEHRLHWHQADPKPPERVVFWRGGIRRDLPRWEQEYVRADAYRGAAEALESLRAAWNEHMAACPRHATLPSFDEINAWMNAPSNTASAAPPRKER